MDWKPLLRAVAAACFLLVHTLLAVVLITGVYFIEAYIKYLWGRQGSLLFGKMPLTYVFDAIDLGVLGVFGIRGAMAAWKAFDDDA